MKRYNFIKKSIASTAILGAALTLSTPAFAAIFTYNVTTKPNPQQPNQPPLAAFTAVIDTEATTVTITANGSSAVFTNLGLAGFKGGDPVPEFYFESYSPTGALILDNGDRIDFDTTVRESFLALGVRDGDLGFRGYDDNNDAFYFASSYNYTPPADGTNGNPGDGNGNGNGDGSGNGSGSVPAPGILGLFGLGGLGLMAARRRRKSSK